MLQIDKINIEKELTFEDVENYMPGLTIDNEVYSDSITQFEITSNEEVVNLFFDETNGEFCIDNCSEQLTNAAFKIGELIQSFHEKGKIDSFIQKIIVAF